jgi:hypothetical protein
MATRIEALASFANSDELGDIGGLIATGETAVVADEYAEELERQGLVEIIDTDVNRSDDGAEDESDGSTSTSSSEEGASEERSFEHTSYVDEDGTFTEELPHHELLAESGVNTFDDLAGIAGAFEFIRGIGPAKAEDLSEAWDEIVSE